MWKSENCFFYLTLAFDCLFEISLNTNTFKQQQKKPVSPVISSLISPSSLCPEPIHRHLRFSPLRGDENCDWSAFPAGNERASLGGLFKQRLIRLQSCSRTAFHVTGRTALLTQADVSHISRPGPDLRGVRCMRARECTKKHECILCMFWDYCCVVFAHTDSLCCLTCQRLVEV